MKIKRFEDLHPVNEEFIGGLIKGALSKLMNMFAAPFKDLAKDFKDFFKEDDPNSIKKIIMDNFNKAIDAAQSEIPKIQNEEALGKLMNDIISTMVAVGQKIGDDIKTSGITKEKVNVVSKISQAVILGNKEAQWAGIVGLLDKDNSVAVRYNGGMNTNYKYSKQAYEKTLKEAGANSQDQLTSKKQAANKFLEGLQNDIKLQMEKEFDEKEVIKMFNSGESQSKKFTEDELNNFMQKKINVVYLKKGKGVNDYKKGTPPNQQPNIVGVKPIHKIENGVVIFLDKNMQPTIKKTFGDIVDVVESENLGQNAKKAKEVLGRIKDDEDKMSKVVKFAEFIEKPENKDKITEIENIIS